MINGKGIESLLETITTHTGRSCLLNSHYSDIKVRQLGDTLFWEMYEKSHINPNGKVYKGKGFKKLDNKLTALYQEKTYTAMPDVLCLIGYTDKTVTYVVVGDVNENRFKNRKTVNEAVICFKKLTFDVTEYELAKCLEKRIAFYDESSLYPITESAIASVGKYMDAIASFKNMPEIPMGGALLISEKLYEMRTMDVIYEDTGKLIKPLLAVCSENYKYLRQNDYFNSIFDLIRDNNLVFNPNNIEWKVEDDATTVLVTLEGMIDMDNPLGANLNYVPVIRIITSELPGVANRVELLAKLGAGYVMVKSNSHYSTNLETKDLMDGVKEAMYTFDDKLKDKYKFSERVYDAIVKIIGKKRTYYIEVGSNGKEVKTPRPFVTKGKEVYLKEFVNDTFRENLPKKQHNELMKYYAELVS